VRPKINDKTTNQWNKILFYLAQKHILLGPLGITVDIVTKISQAYFLKKIHCSASTWFADDIFQSFQFAADVRVELLFFFLRGDIAESLDPKRTCGKRREEKRRDKYEI